MEKEICLPVFLRHLLPSIFYIPEILSARNKTEWQGCSQRVAFEFRGERIYKWECSCFQWPI